jgi:hypothetical protein
MPRILEIDGFAGASVPELAPIQARNANGKPTPTVRGVCFLPFCPPYRWQWEARGSKKAAICSESTEDPEGPFFYPPTRPGIPTAAPIAPIPCISFGLSDGNRIVFALEFDLPLFAWALPRPDSNTRDLSMYAVSKVSLNNFKCFSTTGDPNEVELRPLTLFYGYNNAGKSAFLRGICMVLNSLIHDGPTPLSCTPPVFSSGMTLNDVITKDRGPRIEIGVTLASDGAGTTDLSWTIVDLPDHGTHIVDRFRAKGAFAFSAKWVAGEERDGSLSSLYEAAVDDLPPSPVRLAFHGLLPVLTAPPTVPDRLQDSLGSLRDVASPATFWLGSNRVSGKRSFPKQPLRPRMDTNGEGFETFLHHSWRQPSRLALFDAVSAWYAQNLEQTLAIVEHTRDFEITLTPKDTSPPYQVNLCDVGQGLQETLPLLTAIHAHRIGRFPFANVAVEEPESHLHPRLHGALGREFCALIGQPNAPRVFLETHSQNLLLSVQLEIAKATIAPRDVVVYWFRALGDGTTRAEKVEFDPLGRPNGNWPPGVFADDTELARELITLQQTRDGR